MDEAEFDKFASQYRDMHAANIKISGEEPEYFAEYKIVDIAREWNSTPRSREGAIKVLDFGAGVGYSVPFFARHLPHARVTCLDVSSKSLDIGQARLGNQADFMHFDGKTIPYPDAHFDIGFASCVFHHIPHGEHAGLLREIHRVIKPGGMMFVFEHNPLNPLTRHAVNTCPFDENADLILAPVMRRRLQDSGFESTRVCYRIFFPAFLRKLRPFERQFAWLPLGAQYYVAAQC